jgi:large subunit ribosomal protein L7/L12
VATPAVSEIVDKIATLSAMDLADLSKAIQEKFGVTAAAPMAMMPGMMGGGGASAAAVEEKTEFDLILTSAGDKKINVIKVVRELTSLGLKEAKDLVEAAPQKVKEAMTKDEAMKAKAKLEEQGAQCEIK